MTTRPRGVRLRTAIQTRTAERPEKGQERQVTVQAGDFFGFDLRPSRIFFWLGRGRDEQTRIASLDRKPRVLRYPRQRRFVHIGGGQVSYLGNPLVTLWLAAWGWLRHLRRLRRVS
jgi:hypothetical protein